jgi:CheY-like chemotaxis protein
MPSRTGNIPASFPVLNQATVSGIEIAVPDGSDNFRRRRDGRTHSDGVGEGSRFQIRLPQFEQSEGAVPEPEAIETTLRRVLIVDDNSDAADMLTMSLQLDGHEVQAVYSSRDALERAQSFRPDVMLLDIGLPEINGYEVAERVRSMPQLRDSRLVAVTGYGRLEDRARTRAAGFGDHLVKPVEAIELKRVLRVCQRHTL